MLLERIRGGRSRHEMSDPQSLKTRQMQADDPPALAAALADMKKTQRPYERHWRENVDGERVTLVALLGKRVVGYTNVIWEPDYEACRWQGIPEINDMSPVTHLRKNGMGLASSRTGMGKPISLAAFATAALRSG